MLVLPALVTFVVTFVVPFMLKVCLSFAGFAAIASTR